MKARGQSFLGGAFILTVSSIVVKVIGALFKIPLTAVLGGEGMGYYMTAYTIFNPAFALSVAGISIAVSKLSAAAAARGRYRDRKRILAAAVTIFPMIGLLLSAVIYLAAPFFVELVDNPPALGAVRAMAPALLFCCISSVFRGYFEGARNMAPTALSQVAEALTKLFCGLFFAYRSLSGALGEFEARGSVFGTRAAGLEEALSLAAPRAAAAAVAGVAVSTAAGCLFAAGAYLLLEREGPGRQDNGISFWEAASMLVKTALPVCAAALVINLASMVDLLSVMNRINRAAASDWDALCQSHPELLLAGVTPDRAANFLYGSYTGVAMTVFNLAPAFTSSIGVCALPMISALAARGRRPLLRQRIESVMRITIMAAVPLGMGMSAMSGPILAALFSQSPLEAAVSARLLPVMGIASIFVATSGAVNSMLQAVGRIYAPLKLLLCGSAIKLAVNWALISRPKINISGAPWGSLCCYLFITLAGAAMLMRSVEGSMGLFPMMAKPAAAGAACCITSRLSLIWLAGMLPYRAATALSIALGGIIYLIFLVILGVFFECEIGILENHSKLKKVLLFCRLIPCKSRYNAVE